MSDHKPDLELGIYRVTHTLLRVGNYYTCESDFISRDDQLLSVLEWARAPSGEQYPALTAPLNFELFEEAGQPGYYTYRDPIVHPRETQ